MPVLRGRHAGEGRLVIDGLRHGCVGRDALEGGELAVGQDPEKIDHGLAVHGIRVQRGDGGLGHGGLRLATASG